MKLVQLILVAGLCLIGLTAFAQQQPPPPPAQGEEHHNQSGSGGMASVDEHVQMLSEKLSLTTDQLAKIKPLLQDQIAQMRAVRKDSSLSAGQRLDKIRAIHDATQAKIRDVLTDDQKQKFDAMREHIRRHPSSESDNPPKPN